MKKFIAMLIPLFVVLGCSSPTPEQHVEFWQEMYNKAASDANTAKTPEAYRNARWRMKEYEKELNNAYDATVR